MTRPCCHEREAFGDFEAFGGFKASWDFKASFYAFLYGADSVDTSVVLNSELAAAVDTLRYTNEFMISEVQMLWKCTLCGIKKCLRISETRQVVSALSCTVLTVSFLQARCEKYKLKGVNEGFQ